MIRQAYFNRLLKESEKQVNHGFIQYNDEVLAGVKRVNTLSDIQATEEEIKKVTSYILNFYF